MKYFSRLFFVVLFFLAAQAGAKPFNTSYLSIEIPDAWKCGKEKTYWICKDPRQPQAEILLFLFAKVASPDENIRNFWQKLSLPKTISGLNNIPVQSKVYNIQQVNVSGTNWVQALHGNSELQGFATYYMATVHNNISILASISVVQSQYGKYKNVIASTMYSIKLKNIKVQERAVKPKPKSIIGRLKQRFGTTGLLAYSLIGISIILLALSFKK